MSSISAPRISPKAPVPSRPGSAPAPAKGPGSKGLWMALLFALVMVWAYLALMQFLITGIPPFYIC